MVGMHACALGRVGRHACICPRGCIGGHAIEACSSDEWPFIIIIINHFMDFYYQEVPGSWHFFSGSILGSVNNVNSLLLLGLACI